jgi:hypothetical protein
MRTWENNIRMDLKVVVYGDWRSNDLSMDSVQWRALVLGVLNFWVLSNPLAALGLGVSSTSKRNEYQKQKKTVSRE